MPLLLLSNELLLHIADNLGNRNSNNRSRNSNASKTEYGIIDLYSLCQVSRYLSELLCHCLYRKNVTDCGSYIVQWAAIHNRSDLLRNVLPYNPEVNTTAAIFVSNLLVTLL